MFMKCIKSKNYAHCPCLCSALILQTDSDRVDAIICKNLGHYFHMKQIRVFFYAWSVRKLGFIIQDEEKIIIFFGQGSCHLSRFMLASSINFGWMCSDPKFCTLKIIVRFADSRSLIKGCREVQPE